MVNPWPRRNLYLAGPRGRVNQERRNTMKRIRTITVIALSTLAVLAAQVAPVAAGWGRP